MLNVFLVLIGGGVGSVARYGLGRWLNGFWPYGTFAANVAGGLLMGLVMGFILRNPGEGERMRLLLATGVLGGFTTFSSFSLETVQMLERRDYAGAMIYAGLSVVLSIAAVALGLFIVRKVAA
ncbi:MULTISPECIES: fluoride efflux transporter CrcB [Asticcacaulis]|uniref:fluoride efflux transporter CrcB n=1 Tax=Asticcacaulis TaxID=76890 RepID=UPI001AE1E188|nr:MULTISPECIES: fluoride efflux transporter CrcB [Asticcacaulis]MBP2160730.1 CrcB protein [Asticcacaulis solisilvae]MDR6801775.1 CrcB protein [Asticcacaulis sp. BE141]